MANIIFDRGASSTTLTYSVGRGCEEMASGGGLDFRDCPDWLSYEWQYISGRTGQVTISASTNFNEERRVTLVPCYSGENANRGQWVTVQQSGVSCDSNVVSFDSDTYYVDATGDTYLSAYIEIDESQVEDVDAFKGTFSCTSDSNFITVEEVQTENVLAVLYSVDPNYTGFMRDGSLTFNYDIHEGLVDTCEINIPIIQSGLTCSDTDNVAVWFSYESGITVDENGGSGYTFYFNYDSDYITATTDFDSYAVSDDNFITVTHLELERDTLVEFKVDPNYLGGTRTGEILLIYDIDGMPHPCTMVYTVTQYGASCESNIVRFNKTVERIPASGTSISSNFVITDERFIAIYEGDLDISPLVSDNNIMTITDFSIPSRLVEWKIKPNYSVCARTETVFLEYYLENTSLGHPCMAELVVQQSGVSCSDEILKFDQSSVTFGATDGLVCSKYTIKDGGFIDTNVYGHLNIAAYTDRPDMIEIKYSDPQHPQEEDWSGDTICYYLSNNYTLSARTGTIMFEYYLKDSSYPCIAELTVNQLGVGCNDGIVEFNTSEVICSGDVFMECIPYTVKDLNLIARRTGYTEDNRYYDVPDMYVYTYCEPDGRCDEWAWVEGSELPDYNPDAENWGTGPVCILMNTNYEGVRRYTTVELVYKLKNQSNYCSAFISLAQNALTCSQDGQDALTFNKETITFPQSGGSKVNSFTCTSCVTDVLSVSSSNAAFTVTLSHYDDNYQGTITTVVSSNDNISSRTATITLTYTVHNGIYEDNTVTKSFTVSQDGTNCGCGALTLGSAPSAFDATGGTRYLSYTADSRCITASSITAFSTVNTAFTVTNDYSNNRIQIVASANNTINTRSANVVMQYLIAGSSLPCSQSVTVSQAGLTCGCSALSLGSAPSQFDATGGTKYVSYTLDGRCSTASSISLTSSNTAFTVSNDTSSNPKAIRIVASSNGSVNTRSATVTVTYPIAGSSAPCSTAFTVTQGGITCGCGALTLGQVPSTFKASGDTAYVSYTLDNRCTTASSISITSSDTGFTVTNDYSSNRIQIVASENTQKTVRSATITVTYPIAGSSVPCSTAFTVTQDENVCYEISEPSFISYESGRYNFTANPLYYDINGASTLQCSGGTLDLSANPIIC